MNLLPKSAWRYAFLMIALLCIVAAAAFSVISFLDDRLMDARRVEAVHALSVAVWSLTMGVMFLTGALGLWAIRSTAEIEGRRRIGRFVAAMDYLSDGVILMDAQGHIIGFNPTLRQFLPTNIPAPENMVLSDVFQALAPGDLQLLLDTTCPHEIECDILSSAGLRTLRFRSQPSSGAYLVLVSDITDMRSQEMRRRQTAFLQLLGRIAGGVAHDFNNILCAISGHANLLARGLHDKAASAAALETIQQETQKGALLSRQLLALSRAGISGRPGTHVERHLAEAADLLRLALAPGWTLKIFHEGEFPLIPLSTGQIEQVILNLGLLAADAQRRPGLLTITLARRGEHHLAHAPEWAAVVLLISAEAQENTNLPPPPDGTIKTLPEEEESGAIFSVVKSMVEEVHGSLERFAAPSGARIYRVCLPHLAMPEMLQGADLPSDGLSDYLAGWQVLLAAPESVRHVGLENALRTAGVGLKFCANIETLLGALDTPTKFDAIIMDTRLLPDDFASVLKALLKLCPTAGIIVLCRDPETTAGRELKQTIAFAAYDAQPAEIMRQLIIAKALRSSVKVAGASTKT